MALEAALQVESRAMVVSLGSGMAVGSSTSASNSRLSFPISLRFGVAELKSVSPSKNLPGAKTVLHWCGNKWCCNPGHFFVGSKIYNDEQTSCHKGLHNAESVEQYLGIQTCFCKHEPRCWALPYADAFDLTPAFCETGVLSVVEELGKGANTPEADEYGSDYDLDALKDAGIKLDFD